MGKISAFIFTTLQGYYKGYHEDTSWHNHGEEELKFSEKSLKAGDTLLFGKRTYDMMTSFWPTSEAADLFPKVAKEMNNASKLVVSTSLQELSWENTRLLTENWISELKDLKNSTNITLLGSGNILTQLADNGLLDELQIMIDPVVIGEGTTLFKGIKKQLKLRLEEHEIFNSGVVRAKYSVLD